MKAVADLVRVRLSKWASIEVEPFWRCVGRGRDPLGSKAAARDATRLRAVVPRLKGSHRTGEHLLDIGRRPKTQGCAGTPSSRDPPPLFRTKQSPSDSVGATALTTSSNRLPSAPRRTPTTASLKMEDFGLLKGTPFDFGREWTKDGMTEQQKGSIEECMSEATMEKYMNDNGLRFKMNKTAKEREGLKLFGGLLPEFEVNIPILNVDLKVAAPEVESIWEAIGFTATSNNAARVAEKQKAVQKEAASNQKYADILAYWKEKYGYSKYYPGSWFYYDQLSTDPDENGRGQINTPANRQMSGFRMRKGGFYLDGTKDTRT